MIRFFLNGGALKLPLLILSFIIIFLSIKKIVNLFIRKKLSRTKSEGGLNAILFWGAISALLGFLFHYLGLFQAIQGIADAPRNPSPSLVAWGYAISISKIIWGLSNFIFSLFVWYLLRWRLNNLTKNDNLKI
jgi:hypothetical protein